MKMAKTHPFHSPRTHGFVRVAAATPVVHTADPVANADEHIALIRQAGAQGVELIVFPELSLSGYAIDDLLMQQALLDAVERQIAVVAAAADEAGVIAVVGAPVRNGDALYNCAVVLGSGAVLGVVPKTYLPNYREYYEKRWFAPAASRSEDTILLNGETVDFAPGLIFEAVDRPGFVFAAEICEDFWAPQPPSTRAALAGARILLNLSASNIVIGKADERALLCASQSARTLSAYVFTASGWGESTTDLAWDGQAIIHELGACLASGERFAMDSHLTIADIDVERIGLDRLRNGTFADCARIEGEPATVVPFEAGEGCAADDLIRPLDRFPFVPDDPARLDQDCYEAFNIQVQGLMRRMKATHGEKIVIGVSGGLDSTQALLVACRAFDRLDLPRTGILGYTLPGFATSEGTKSNAWALMKALGVTGAEIDIRPTAQTMLEAIGHPFARGEPVHDITFENVQAGLRTDYLFRLANQNGAFVLGTGDLSELALGWATYGVGDHMSHYNVNGGVAKTLIRHLIRWVATKDYAGEAAAVLNAVLDTEISPELVPAGADGKLQSTEATVGPYALNDFFLFYVTRFGLKPSKVAYLAHQAWKDAATGHWPAGTPEAERIEYDLAAIKHWLRKFLFRFFQTSQFKRSALPNGPKVVTGGSLSPRGDWRAPSDATARVWLDELEANVPD
ncbi:MAG: NAD(+) synthase [Alphaproteobacteria bacterium]|jgi:NAD+ synthase (glutamine-hydrolysing)|nr:NAD(+) synthase [Alphaproteobacteria bacterium]MBU2043310.1 NAD(+) synthase [Alphaproteobacteria bacterium]MBU2124412.1 NAD(+) synthase [Alphaproteobacteria bacterium]MBU2209062.1 NAD(+) synthase [Alphaproteobacteria bacterium]MBU2290729.1 NAD(+) synthase [Alphaproteobacteria bacterium]